MAVHGGYDRPGHWGCHRQTERHDAPSGEQVRKGSGECRQARSRRIESQARLENGSSPDEIAGPSKAKRKAGEHDRPHQADPLDGRQASVEFFLDSRKQYADTADALHVEKRSEANDQENA